MIKKIISTVMALGVIISVSSTSAYADTASDKAKIQQVQSQRNDLENKAEIMNNQRETIMSKINSNERNITTTQKQIKQTMKDIVKAEDNIKAEQIIFNERMRVMYMNGSSSYLDIILGSDGIEDFMSRIENIKTIVSFNQKVTNALKTKQEAINSKKEALDTGKVKLLSLRSNNKKELNTLTKQKTDQDVLASKLDALEDKYGAQLVINEAIDAKQAIEAKQAIKAKKDAEAKQALINSEKAIAKQNEASKQVISTPEAETSTSSDLDLLARIITAEAGGESYKAQVAVGAVVLNRVKSSYFPNSIR
ncbi:MAG: cell wall hydrolase, partial [Clostridium sp.]